MKKIKQIKEFLRKNNNFIVVGHTSPEADCLGAQLAFAEVLRSLGKKCEVVNEDCSSKEYAFLPQVDKIRCKPKSRNFDAAIIVDCSDISRIGNVANFINSKTSILNIDHHIFNSNFGLINVVYPEASSACEILYFLFRELKLEINKNAAICLYSGIVGDTGSFRYPSTSYRTHLAASNLMRYGINADWIYKNIYENLTFLDLRLINTVLQKAKKDKTGKIVWVKLPKETAKKYEPQIDLADNILNLIRSIGNAEVGVLIREKKGEERHVRVNLRSRGRIDVNEVARYFGGGGHKTASGVTFRNISIDEVERKVIGFIKKQVSRDK